MHVIVVGCGRVGSEVALQPRRPAEHDVIVIDRQLEAFRRLGDDFKGTTMVGVGFDRDVLTEAGITPDCAVAAVTSGDNSNILIARVARETFGVKHVVARIYDPRRASIYERLGIATVASVDVDQRTCAAPFAVATESTPDWIDPSAKFTIVERRVPAAAAGMTVANIEAASERTGGRAGRFGEASIPSAATLLQEDDVLHVVIPADNAAQLDAALQPTEGSHCMNVIIAGAGSVGRYMAGQLQDSGHNVTLIDNDTAVVTQGRATRTPVGVTWCLGDACEVATLTAVGAAEADVVAAVTGDDEDNLVVSLLSKQEFAVPRVVARVNNPKNEWMFNDMWGVDVSVSTPHLLTGLVEEAVTVGSFVRLLSLEGGKARLAEVTLAAGSPAIAKELTDLGLPRESTVVAVLRDGHVVVPRGDTVLHQGDEVLVLVTGGVEDDVRRALVG